MKASDGPSPRAMGRESSARWSPGWCRTLLSYVPLPRHRPVQHAAAVGVHRPAAHHGLRAMWLSGGFEVSSATAHRELQSARLVEHNPIAPLSVCSQMSANGSARKFVSVRSAHGDQHVVSEAAGFAWRAPGLAALTLYSEGRCRPCSCACRPTTALWGGAWGLRLSRTVDMVAAGARPPNELPS